MNQNSKLPLGEDSGLVLKVANGDIEAFERLHQRYAPLLKQFFVIRGVGRNSADDLVQKIFTHLWQQRKNFRGVSSFEAYLFGIARNTLYNEIRRSRTITGISSKKLPKFYLDTGKMSQPEAEFYFQELTDALEAAKDKLTDEQLQALEAAHDPDVDFHKVLGELGCSKEAYKSHLKRARKRLMEFLAPLFTDEERHKEG
jgi:RNA polymerase sigma-70 factor (ECF subfamily)